MCSLRKKIIALLNCNLGFYIQALVLFVAAYYLFFGEKKGYYNALVCLVSLETTSYLKMPSRHCDLLRISCEKETPLRFWKPPECNWKKKDPRVKMHSRVQSHVRLFFLFKNFTQTHKFDANRKNFSVWRPYWTKVVSNTRKMQLENWSLSDGKKTVV